jgi:hypothetical protein
MAAELKVEFDAFVQEARAALAEIKSTGTYPIATYTAELETRLKEIEALLVKTSVIADAATVTSAAVQSQYHALDGVQIQQQTAFNGLQHFVQSQAATTKGAGKGHGGDSGGWQFARPKDLAPNTFSGKEEEWAAWRESVEDYAD